MHPAVVVKNLGVWFDANFSFANHVRNICKTCFIQIRDLRRVRKHLTDEAAILAANALVSSRLDYWKQNESVQSQYRKLQSINGTCQDCHQTVSNNAGISYISNDSIIVESWASELPL